MNECKNCGADYALHHADTDQCPMNGREAPVGHKQEWKSTKFEERTTLTPQAYEKMMALIFSLEKRINALEEYFGDSQTHGSH